jgi:hypothetical protein
LPTANEKKGNKSLFLPVFFFQSIVSLLFSSPTVKKQRFSPLRGRKEGKKKGNKLPFGDEKNSPSGTAMPFAFGSRRETKRRGNYLR